MRESAKRSPREIMGHGQGGMAATPRDRRQEARRHRGSARSQWKLRARHRAVAFPRRRERGARRLARLRADARQHGQLAVPEVADFCVVVLRGEDESVRWAHSAIAIRASRRSWTACAGSAADRPAEHPISKALRFGQPQLDSDVRRHLVLDWREREAAPAGARARSSRRSPCRSSARRTFDAILFVVHRGIRAPFHGTHDLELAIDVGGGGLRDRPRPPYTEAERAARARRDHGRGRAATSSTR